MENSCAYCGEEVLGEGYKQNDQVFCSEQCVDAANRETFDFLDAHGYDDS